MRIGFVGAGAVAHALAVAFDQAGEQIVAIASRDVTSAERLASRVAHGIPVSTAQDVIAHADVVFLTVPDEAIQSVCASVTWTPEHTVLHCSGALSLDVLTAARQAGARVGSFHPLQSFSGDENDATRFVGVTIGIEADDQITETLHHLATAIGSRPLMLHPQQKALYHAAAVMISNYTVTLAALAAELWGALGIEQDAAMPLMMPLLQGTVTNIADRGVPGALTGPIARGDCETVRRHLTALSQQYPEMVPVYTALGLRTVPLALQRGGIDRRMAETLTDLLRSDHGAR